MRTIERNHFDKLCGCNPAYMDIGQEIILVSFPGENVGDPGWDHAMVMKKLLIEILLWKKSA